MAKKVKVDFGGVDKEIKRRGKSARIPEGEYAAKVVDAELQTSEKSGSRYFRWKFQIVRGEHKGATIYGNTSLKPDALWSLRNLIHAATGKNFAGKSLTLDPEKLYGKIVGVSVTDNEWEKDGQTKISSQVDSAFPEAELEGAEDDAEEEEEDDDEETTTEEAEDEDLEEVDVDEL